MSEAIVFPSHIRRALLNEHVVLREMLGEVTALAERVVAGVAPAVERRFLRAVDGLRRSLQGHNAVEEAELSQILGQADAWGPLRVERMMHEHAEEHAALRALLRAPTALALAKQMPTFADELRRHMAVEEKAFLNREMLRDDVITLGPTS